MSPALTDSATRSMSGSNVSIRSQSTVALNSASMCGDVRVVAVLVRPGEVQVLPVADARHQPDSKQVGQAEDRRTLALGVGVEGVGLERRLVLADEVQD